MTGQRTGKPLYLLNIKIKTGIYKEGHGHVCAVTSTIPLSIWHKRMARVLNIRKIKQMKTQQVVDSFVIHRDKETKIPVCELQPALEKMHRLPFPVGRMRAKEGQNIHSDVIWPVQEASLKRTRYYVVFKDDCSGWWFVNFLENKSEESNHFRSFVARLKAETEKKRSEL
jgi:hypothetical protein